MVGAGCLGLFDVSRDRYRQPLRSLLISMLEGTAFCESLVLLPDSLIAAMMTGVPGLRRRSSPLFQSPMAEHHSDDVDDTSFISCIVARIQLACILSANIRQVASDFLTVAPSQPETGSELLLPDDTYSWDFGTGPEDNIDDFLVREQSLVLGPSVTKAASLAPTWKRTLYYMKRATLSMPRIVFLALAADPAFGRELYYGLRFVGNGPAAWLRPALVGLFTLARKLNAVLVRTTLWSSRPYMWLLRHSMQGLNRTVHTVGGKVAVVERHRPFKSSTGFAHHFRGRRRGEVQLRLNVYPGSVAKEFKSWSEPADRKGVMFEAVYQGRPHRASRVGGGHHGLVGVPRMVSRFGLDGDGVVKHTFVYVYADSKAEVPSGRVKFDGLHDDSDDEHDPGQDRGGDKIVAHQRAGRRLNTRTVSRLHNRLKDDVQAWAEAGVERAKYDAQGRVVAEVVRCHNSTTGATFHVAARYRFGEMDPNAVIEALYEFKNEWALLVRKWTRSDAGRVVASQRVINVLTSNRSACYKAEYSYLHPRHPHATTSLLDVRLFRRLRKVFGTGDSDQVWRVIDRTSGASVNMPPLVKDDLLGLVKRDAFTSFMDENLLHVHGMRVSSPFSLGTRRHLLQAVLFLFSAGLVWLADFAFGSPFPNREWWVLTASVVAGALLTFNWPSQLTFATHRYYTQPLSISLARMMLWTLWRTRVKGAQNLEAVHARMLDEQLLRGAPALRQYWRERDHGNLHGAHEVLERNHDAVVAAMYFPDDKSFRSHLHLRLSDLEACSTGGDASLLVAQSDLKSLTRLSGHKLMQAVGLDSGTWPMDGGGVASCRRDLVDRIKTVRWHMQAEIGHELRSIKAAYQVERNVLSMQYVPLWGHNFGHLSQTIRSEPFSTFDVARLRSNKNAIRKYFLPLLSQFVVACVTPNLREEDIERVTLVVCNMYRYFQHFDWAATWKDAVVHRQWCTLWSHYVSLMNDEELLLAEHPTVDNLEEALSFFVHFLTPLSVPIQAQATVVQSTHHGIQALLGVVAKRIHNCAFVIWDHGILWRERLLALSGFKGASLFSRNALMGMQRLCAYLTLHNADIMVPCTNIGNPGWEAWLAGGRGDSRRMALAHERISPVVNGMETDRFSVDRTVEEKLPSAVMLSHVCDVKDVMNAILAANVIVNEFGIRDYRLIIYGSIKVRKPLCVQTVLVVLSLPCVCRPVVPPCMH